MAGRDDVFRLCDLEFEIRHLGSQVELAVALEEIGPVGRGLRVLANRAVAIGALRLYGALCVRVQMAIAVDFRFGVAVDAVHAGLEVSVR